MRIAFSGTHRSGKSTLLERVSERLGGYATIDEPYHLLEEEGYETPESPGIADFEAQLERSLVALEEDEEDILFDRCPADILAYLLTHEDSAAFEPDEILDRVRDAMQTLDLVVLVSVEARDRIAVASGEDRDLRRAVADKLEEIWTDDTFGFDVEVLRVHGDLKARVQQVMDRIDAVSKAS